MASITDIILQKPYVLLWDETTSIIGVEMQNSQLALGRVVHINELEDKYAVEDIVWYDPNDVKAIFKFEFFIYKLIDSNKILFKETIP